MMTYVPAGRGADAPSRPIYLTVHGYAHNSDVFSAAQLEAHMVTRMLSSRYRVVNGRTSVLRSTLSVEGGRAKAEGERVRLNAHFSTAR